MTPAGVPDWLSQAEMSVEGALTEASNLTLRVQFEDGAGTTGCHRGVYKPRRGERPLYDFPIGTLACREVTAYLVSQWGGWHLVPPTVLREGPLGPGSVQQWVEAPTEPQEPGADLVDVVRPEELRAGWLPVLQAQDRYGDPLLVVHADDPDLAALAVLDAVLNNADRKAAHIARDDLGQLWGFDHGLCGHTQPKLRTVLWGWAGQPLPEREVERLSRLVTAVSGPCAEELTRMLSGAESLALLSRAKTLLQTGTFPQPPLDRSALPWPLW